jgi:hypothetical protein
VPDRNDDLVHLFVRDLDRIELPPRERWRPIQRKESYIVKVSRYVLYAGAMAAVLVAALIVGLALRDRNAPVASSPSPVPAASTQPPASPTPTTPAPTPTPTSSPTASPPATVQTGAITGRFGYPSDFIPALTVYAISVSDPKVFFSVDFPGYGNPPRPTLPPGVSQPTYTITGIAPGTYYVLAYRNDNNPGIGVYTHYTVDCTQATTGGQSSTPAPGCAAADQSLLPVTVHAGETVSRIDITDWVFQQNGYPPRPQ